MQPVERLSYCRRITRPSSAVNPTPWIWVMRLMLVFMFVGGHLITRATSTEMESEMCIPSPLCGGGSANPSLNSSAYLRYFNGMTVSGLRELALALTCSFPNPQQSPSPKVTSEENSLEN